jgi:hypothetical protein
MNVEDIVRAYQDAIHDAVSDAGARTDDDARSRLSGMATVAGNEISRTDEDMHERAVQDGVAAYKWLVGEIVRQARTMRMFPDLNRHALDGALRAKGPNPPFW